MTALSSFRAVLRSLVLSILIWSTAAALIVYGARILGWLLPTLLCAPSAGVWSLLVLAAVTRAYRRFF